MPDSCSLSLSRSTPLSHLPSTHGRKPRSPFAASEASLTVNANLLVHREAISFFSPFLSLSLSVSSFLSIRSSVPLFFRYVALSFSLSFPVHRQPCRPFPLKFSVADVIVPSLLSVRKNQPRLPLPFDGIGLPRLPNEKTGNAAAVPNRLPNKVRIPPVRFFPPHRADRCYALFTGLSILRKSGEIGRKIIRRNW